MKHAALLPLCGECSTGLQDARIDMPLEVTPKCLVLYGQIGDEKDPEGLARWAAEPMLEAVGMSRATLFSPVSECPLEKFAALSTGKDRNRLLVLMCHYDRKKRSFFSGKFRLSMKRFLEALCLKKDDNERLDVMMVCCTSNDIETVNLPIYNLRGVDGPMARESRLPFISFAGKDTRSPYELDSGTSIDVPSPECPNLMMFRFCFLALKDLELPYAEPYGNVWHLTKASGLAWSVLHGLKEWNIPRWVGSLPIEGNFVNVVDALSSLGPKYNQYSYCPASEILISKERAKELLSPPVKEKLSALLQKAEKQVAGKGSEIVFLPGKGKHCSCGTMGKSCAEAEFLDQMDECPNLLAQTKAPCRTCRSVYCGWAADHTKSMIVIWSGGETYGQTFTTNVTNNCGAYVFSKNGVEVCMLEFDGIRRWADEDEGYAHLLEFDPNVATSLKVSKLKEFPKATVARETSRNLKGRAPDPIVEDALCLYDFLHKNYREKKLRYAGGREGCSKAVLKHCELRLIDYEEPEVPSYLATEWYLDDKADKGYF